MSKEKACSLRKDFFITWEDRERWTEELIDEKEGGEKKEGKKYRWID